MRRPDGFFLCLVFVLGLVTEAPPHFRGVAFRVGMGPDIVQQHRANAYGVISHSAGTDPLRPIRLLCQPSHLGALAIKSKN
jgi:hypothetical protein